MTTLHNSNQQSLQKQPNTIQFDPIDRDLLTNNSSSLSISKLSTINDFNLDRLDPSSSLIQNNYQPSNSSTTPPIAMKDEQMINFPKIPITKMAPNMPSTKKFNQSYLKTTFSTLQDGLSTFSSSDWFEKNPQKIANDDENIHGPSWSKYLALQLKNQQLEKKIINQQNVNTQHLHQIAQFQNIINKIQQQHELHLQQIKSENQKKLLVQKNHYYQQLSESHNQINQLKSKLHDQTKISLSEEIKQYIAQILNNNLQLKQRIKQLLISKQFIQKSISNLQTLNLTHHQSISKLQTTIQLLSKQLNQANAKIKSKIQSPELQFHPFYQIINSQSIQIRQLNTALQTINHQYRKFKKAQSEAMNSIPILKRQYSNFTKQQNTLNQQKIINLSYILTKKQNQNNMLKAKITNLQSRHKNALQEIKRKTKELNLIQNTQLAEKTSVIKHEYQINSKYQGSLKIRAQLRDLARKMLLKLNITK